MGGVLSHEAHATLLTVTSLADAGPGTLRDQVAAAAPGDTINFSVTGTIPLTTGVIAINKNLNITGPGAGSLTVAGDAHDSILTIGGGTVGISGLTLTNGGGTSALAGSENTYVGGANYMSAGTATVADCTVTANNNALYGAGIYLASGSLTIERGTISNNGVGYVGQGGGIYVEGGSLAVTDSTISGNIAGYGAGLFSSGGDTTVTLTNTTLFREYRQE